MKHAFLSFLFPSASAEESALPEGFAYVKDLIPDCIEQMRYAGEENFVGAVVENSCVLPIFGAFPVPSA